MWEDILGYPIEQAENDALWEEYNKPDNSYVQHALGMAAFMELIRRGLIKVDTKKN